MKINVNPRETGEYQEEFEQGLIDVLCDIKHNLGLIADGLFGIKFEIKKEVKEVKGEKGS